MAHSTPLQPVTPAKLTVSPNKQSGDHGCLLPVTAGDLRTGLMVANLKQSFLDTLFCALGRVPSAATLHDLYTALALAIRDRVLKQGVQTLETYHARDARVVAFQTHVDCQEQVSVRWRDSGAWTRQFILTVARMGRSSSDRAIREYAENIWRVQPMPVPEPPGSESQRPGAESASIRQARR